MTPRNLLALCQGFQLLFNDENLALLVGLAVTTATCTVVRDLRRRNRVANRIRHRDYALNEMEVMSEQQFKRMFRMGKATFKQLVIKLEDTTDLPCDAAAQNSSGSAINMTTRLACTLRWLAGGSYLDICFEFGVAPGSFFQEDGVLWGTMNAIDAAFDLYFPFDDDDRLRKEANNFAAFSHGHLKYCVLAIDGWVCRTRCPTDTEVRFPMSYRNRHECFGIVVLAGCFANLKFGMFSCISCGSTNDTMAWDLCAMNRAVEEGLLPKQYYFIGDEAFVNRDQFLVPYSGSGLERAKDSFNYHLSSMRQCIERAFSLLTQRWGIFWRPLRCSYDKWTLVCMVAAKLHNFCIDENEGTRHDIAPRYDADHMEGDDPAVYLNPIDCHPDEPRNRPCGRRRKNLTDMLEALGIYRPSR